MNIRKYIWAYVVAMALICPGVKAQEQITIGVIQYDVREIRVSKPCMSRALVLVS